MEVKSLEIEKPQYGENAGKYVGKVTLEGEGGRQEVRLSDGSISAIFAVIRQQVVDSAKLNAKQVDKAMDNATHGPLLGQAATIPELPSE